LPKPVKLAERYRFYNRRQHPEELAAEYLAELRKMASTCEFGTFLEEALCDRLVCGLKDEGMQCRLLAESELSLQKVFDPVQGMEAAAKNAKEICADSNATPIVEAANLITNTRSRKLPCNRCLGVGHDPTSC